MIDVFEAKDLKRIYKFDPEKEEFVEFVGEKMGWRMPMQYLPDPYLVWKKRKENKLQREKPHEALFAMHEYKDKYLREKATGG